MLRIQSRPSSLNAAGRFFLFFNFSSFASRFTSFVSALIARGGRSEPPECSCLIPRPTWPQWCDDTVGASGMDVKQLPAFNFVTSVSYLPTFFPLSSSTPRGTFRERYIPTTSFPPSRTLVSRLLCGHLLSLLGRPLSLPSLLPRQLLP